MKQHVLMYFKTHVKDEPIRQCDILRDLSKSYYNESNPTKGSYESFRGTFFRTAHKYEFLLEGYHRVTIGSGVYWVVGKSDDVIHNYDKPSEYFEWLQSLPGKRLITLAGTTAHCVNYINDKEVIKIDQSPLVNDAIRCDVFKFPHKEDDSINLDFEGRLTIGRVNDINRLIVKTILLTHRIDKNSMKFLKKLKYKILNEMYYTSGRHLMHISMLQLK